MPTYEYRCSQCQHPLEARQSMNDPALVHCPECGKDTLQRLISRSNFQLKGQGWYVTDYAKKSPANTSDSSIDSEAKTMKDNSISTTVKEDQTTDVKQHKTAEAKPKTETT